VSAVLIASTIFKCSPFRRVAGFHVCSAREG
jgi:hypothetical protein